MSLAIWLAALAGCTPSVWRRVSVMPVRLTMFSGSVSPSGSLTKVSILPAILSPPEAVRSTRRAASSMI